METVVVLLILWFFLSIAVGIVLGKAIQYGMQDVEKMEQDQK